MGNQRKKTATDSRFCSRAKLHRARQILGMSGNKKQPLNVSGFFTLQNTFKIPLILTPST